MMNSIMWRRAVADDLDAVMPIQDRVHSMLPESREVFADKLRFSPETFLVLLQDGKLAGYGIAHPWSLDSVPRLDTLLGEQPDSADCLFIHDVAILPQARSLGAGRVFVERMKQEALGRRLAALTLVSVYDSYPIWARCGFETDALSAGAEKLAQYGDGARYMVARLT
jgi:hypothetical protein